MCSARDITDVKILVPNKKSKFPVVNNNKWPTNEFVILPIAWLTKKLIWFTAYQILHEGSVNRGRYGPFKYAVGKAKLPHLLLVVSFNIWGCSGDAKFIFFHQQSQDTSSSVAVCLSGCFHVCEPTEIAVTLTASTVEWVNRYHRAEPISVVTRWWEDPETVVEMFSIVFATIWWITESSCKE